jgi:hypothetical protein
MSGDEIRKAALEGKTTNVVGRSKELRRLLETVELLGHGAAGRNEVRDNMLVGIEKRPPLGQ